MILSKCVVCGSKKLKFIKKQEASWLLSCLGIKTPLRKYFFRRSSSVLGVLASQYKIIK